MRFPIAVISLFFAFANQSLAQQAPPGWGEAYRLEAQARIDAGQVNAVVDELLLMSPAQSADHELDYFLGVAAIKAKRYPLALDALERVVLVRPEHAGAWLDLALVYQRLGDSKTAFAILEHVESNFSPSDALKTELGLIRRQISAGAAISGWRYEWGLQLGHARNPNSGLDDLSLTLRPVAGPPILVQLDPSLRPRQDYFALTRLTAFKTDATDSGASSELLISVGARDYFSQSAFDQRDMILAWASRKPVDSGHQLQFGASLRGIDQTSQGLLSISSLTLGYLIPQASCLYGARFEPEWRHYSDSSRPSSLTPWVGLSIRCLSTAVGYVAAGLRFGTEGPSADRAGGDTRRAEATTMIRYPFTPDLALEAVALIGRYQDQTSFSPLLAGGDPRLVERFLGRLGIEKQVYVSSTNRLFVSAHYELLQDKSNIPIAGLSDRQILVGSRLVF